MSNQGGVLATTRAQIKSLRSMLEGQQDRLAGILPTHLSAERVMRVAMADIQRTPKLLECQPGSVIGSIVQASELGLEVGSVLGHAYLVPFKGRCQLIVGYRGMIDLARRSGQILSIHAHVVRQHDDFTYELGMDPQLSHRPNLKVEPRTDGGDVTAAYAVARLKDGGVQFEVMSRVEIDAIRKNSPAGNFGPWVTNFPEMARKTPLRRLFKMLPASVEMMTAATHVDAPDHTQAAAVLDMGAADDQAAEGAVRSKLDEAKDKLAKAPPADDNATTEDTPTTQQAPKGEKPTRAPRAKAGEESVTVRTRRLGKACKGTYGLRTQGEAVAALKTALALTPAATDEALVAMTAEAEGWQVPAPKAPPGVSVKLADGSEYQGTEAECVAWCDQAIAEAEEVLDAQRVVEIHSAFPGRNDNAATRAAYFNRIHPEVVKALGG